MCKRRGATNTLYLMVIGSIAVVVVLSLLLLRGIHSDEDSTRTLVLYCAAGMREPMEQIIKDYEDEFGVKVEVTYGGSNTLLNQLTADKSGDLYLAGDDIYIEMARDRKLAREAIPLARWRPVIIVQREGETAMASIDDLLNPQLRIAVGNPEQAAIGRKTRKLLRASGHWEELNRIITEHGVFGGTVKEVVIAVKSGSADAGIVWDATAAQNPELRSVPIPELDAGLADIEIAVLESCGAPASGLKFARYAAVRDRGLKSFQKFRYNVVDGDKWEEKPQLTFFYGAVNRKALDPIIAEFEKREGVKVNAVPGGCGTLTSQMRTMEVNQDKGFPDTYMACDIHYLKTVQDLFEQGTLVSDTDIVIVVAKDNPKNIESLEDLARPDVRVALGQPDQCTIGVLSQRLLKAEGVWSDKFAEVAKKPTSAMLVPAITSGAADAVLAYRSDTLAERQRLRVITIDSDFATAVQPFSIALSSEHKHLGQRLFDTILRNRDKFEKAGFHWRLDGQAVTSDKGGSLSSGDDSESP